MSPAPDDAMQQPGGSLADELITALKRAGVGLAAGVPESMLKSIYFALAEDPDIRYVNCANETDAVGIVVGAYFGGTRAVAIMENSGIRQACEAIARLGITHQCPMTIIMPFRGELGEKNWWGDTHGVTLEPVLHALRVRYEFIDRVHKLRSAVQKALDHADAAQRPVALILTGECLKGN